MYNFSISIVTFNNNCTFLKKTLQSCLNTDLHIKVSVVDNSHNSAIQALCEEMYIDYTDLHKNIGFAAAHNSVITAMLDCAEYHLILNPDVYFSNGVLEELYSFAQANHDVGLLVPKVLYPNGTIQYVCKLLPNPFDFALRRFIDVMPNLLHFFKKRDELYELRFTGYNKLMDVPFLSGCCMCIRNEVFKTIGVFDPRYFMYLEDVDLTRRIRRRYRTVYYPNVFIYHDWQGGSRKNFKLLLYQLASSIKYFNKWGWFFDKERSEINKKVLQQLKFQTQ